MKSYLPISYVSVSFVIWQKRATLTREAYMIYMAFKKLSHYLCNAKVTTKCDHASLHKFLTTHTSNSKVKNWETEIESMNHVNFKHIEGTENILADSISCLR